MQLEEHYIVEHVGADGKVSVEQFDDPAEALHDYGAYARMLGRGEKVKLHRYSTVVLASSVRAK
ncbi:hypothetical protein AB0F77_39760 [Streptomyces sp. NPDC026672]|uniref:hypothetical protein n=1 Tax=Actinomycetes TaxID=1760 RepID=UPI0033E3FCDA